jgi:hydrogenase maturation protease
MRQVQIKEIANAVLYEGYLLYPYRHSAIKNRQRWTFGVIYPRAYSEAQGALEPWTMRTECLAAGSAETMLDVTVRFLHLLVRRSLPIDGARTEETAAPQAGAAETAGQSQTDHWTPDTWEEGSEREVCAPTFSLGDLVAHPQRVEISFPGARIVERVGSTAEIVREQQPLAGAFRITAEALTVPVSAVPVFKVSVQIENTTPGTGEVSNRHEEILLHSFISTHTILQVRQGAFISLLDPPEELRAAAQACQNSRTWPVLVGKEGEHDAMLSSPIILYDYPQIAPESTGPLFDGTEIDELLTLRIMTLTDAEKQEMRQADERARELLEHTESLSPEDLLKLHGAVRRLRPVEEGGQCEQSGSG